MTKEKPKRSANRKGRFSARKKAEAVRRLVHQVPRRDGHERTPTG